MKWHPVPAPDDRDGWQNARGYCLLLVLCAGLLFLAGLGRCDLWNPDEPRVAGIAAEMARTGDLVVPRLNGRPFLEKPPLGFWCIAGAFRVLGEHHFAARIALALAAIGGALLVFVLARAMGYGAPTAFVAGFVLATSMEYWTVGRRCIVDMVLCFFTTGAGLCFFNAIRSQAARIPWATGFVLSLGGALMTKGLVGLAVPLSALFVWRLLERDFSIRTWALLGLGPLLSLIPAAIWLSYLYGDLGREAVWVVVWKNNFERFTGEYAQHINPLYFYFEELPEGFLPWTLFLPAAFIDHFKAARARETGQVSRFLLAWILVPFLLLSLSAGKRQLYMLPLYPAAALLVGTTLGTFLEGKRPSTRWITVPVACLAAAIIVFSLGLSGVCIYFRKYILSVPVAVPGLVLGIWALRSYVHGNFARTFQLIVVSLVALLLGAGIWILPAFNARKSYVPLFEYCSRLDSQGFQFILYDGSERLRGAAVFYLGKTLPDIHDPATLSQILKSAPKTVVICEEDDMPGASDTQILESFEIGHRMIIVGGHTSLGLPAPPAARDAGGVQ